MFHFLSYVKVVFFSSALSLASVNSEGLTVASGVTIEYLWCNIEMMDLGCIRTPYGLVVDFSQ